MRVTIVLPDLRTAPVGGYKVQYEYARELADRGHRVTIVHPRFLLRRPNILRYGYTLIKRWRLGHRIISWYAVDARVRISVPPVLAGWLLPKADVTVLTGWRTAEATRNPARRAGVLVQVVYDYELWMAIPNERAAMQSAFRRSEVAQFATSGPVAGMLSEMGVPSDEFVPAGIDLNLFGCKKPPGERGHLVGFAFRSNPVKAMPVMLEACDIIQSRRPDIVFAAYGERPRDPHPKVDYRGPLSSQALVEFYNECSVFVLPSDYEGWGLPVAEAMACGAAVVTTANGGTADFVEDRVDALVVPCQDPGAIVDAIEELIDNRNFRLSLVESALEKAKRLGLVEATDRFESVLKTAAAGGYN